MLQMRADAEAKMRRLSKVALREGFCVLTVCWTTSRLAMAQIDFEGGSALGEMSDFAKTPAKRHARNAVVGGSAFMQRVYRIFSLLRFHRLYSKSEF